MPTWDVKVEGSSVEHLFDVDVAAESGDQLGISHVAMGNTSANRGIESGDQTVIYKNGSEVFDGYVITQPSRANRHRVNDVLEMGVADKRYELKHLNVSRPFYQMDPGEILIEAIEKRSRPLRRQFIFTGGSLSGWSSTTSEFQLTNFTSGGYRDYGSSMIFAGFASGASGSDTITYSSVPSAAIPGDGQISELVTRMLVALPVGSYEMEVGLQDNAGNLYVWPVEHPRADFHEYTFSADLAEPGRRLITSGDLSNGELRYAIRLDGELDSNRGLALDAAYTKPFALDARSPALGTSGIQTTGRSITRRFDQTVFEILETLATEDQAISYVDENDDLHFEPAGQTSAPYSIDYASTPVVEATVDRDYDRIRNAVTVIGNEERGVQVTVRDEASVKFYGVEERADDITDPTLVTDQQAITRGEGYLAEHAWSDIPMEFVIADTDYATIQPGQSLSVSWPPEDVDGTYIAESVETDKHGFVTVGVTGSGA